MTPEARRQRARLGGLTTAARGRVNTGPATAAAEARFAAQVIREAEARGETLTPEQVTKRAFYAREVFYARLAYLSAKARSARSRRNRWAASVAETPETAREDDDAAVDLVSPA